MRNLSNFKTSIDDLVGITSSLLPPANNSNQTSFTFGIKSHGKIGCTWCENDSVCLILR